MEQGDEACIFAFKVINDGFIADLNSFDLVAVELLESLRFLEGVPAGEVLHLLHFDFEFVVAFDEL